GSLPTGLSLSTGGTISGTPTIAHTRTFTVQVTSDGLTDDQQLTIEVEEPTPAPEITTTSLPKGTRGEGYSQTLQATGGDDSYAWTIVSGSLPTGLSLSTGGTISGTPTIAHTRTFTVQVTSDGLTDDQQLTIEIEQENRDPSVQITSPADESEFPLDISGTTVSFTATASDPDGDPLECSWRVGSVDQIGGNCSGFSRTFDNLGRFRIWVEVSDGRGGINADWADIEIVQAYGDIAVRVITTGYREDDEGYDLYIFQLSNSPAAALSNNESVTFEGAPVGEYLLSLDGDPSNCDIQGARQRSIDVRPDTETEVEYWVDCADESGFQIDVQFVGGGISASRQGVIRDAIRYWENIITSNHDPRLDLERTSGFLNSCANRSGYTSLSILDADIDDMLVYVDAGPIDGTPSSDDTWAYAGACLARGGGGAPLVGRIRIDEENLAGISTADLWELAFHEAGHTLAFSQGLIDRVSGSLLTTDGGGIRRFNGSQARDEYGNLGGVGSPPFESGSAHWSEDTFGTEIMTPYLHSGVVEPISALTIALADDLYYSVSYDYAENFTLPGATGGDVGQVGIDRVDDQPVAEIHPAEVLPTGMGQRIPWPAGRE
ncbi:MAG: putative Ig domain-containing protein, partial [Longimicrobiales bacterium]